MNLRDLVIDAQKTLGDNLMLVDVLPSYAYDSNGQKTSNICAYKYVVCVPKLSLDKISIKIDGDLLIEKPDGNSFPVVEFDDLTLSLYWSKNGSYQVSAKASGIRLVNEWL